MSAIPYGGNDSITANSSDLQLPKLVPVTYWTCFFVNSPNGTFESREKNKFYKCTINFSYALDSECSIGRSLVPCGFWICVAVTAIIVLVASFGIVFNSLNFIILPKSLHGSSVKRLIILLAVFDMLATICAIPVSLLMILILGRYVNSYGALEAFRILHLLFSLGRTGSIFTTIMITIERYIAIAYPIKQWVASKKVRLHIITVVCVVILLNTPWWINKKTDINDLYREKIDNQTHDSNLSLSNNSFNVSEYKNDTWNDLSEFPYVFKGTRFAKAVYPKIVTYHIFLDFAFPFPMLLIFNGLLYRSIYLSNKARQTLTISQRREVNAAKMFSIVAFILLLCHTVAFTIFVCTQVRRAMFRELQFLQVLATTLNAAINFLVYYLLGKSFRDEFWTFVRASKKVFGSSKVELATVSPSPRNSKSISNGTIELRMNSTSTKSSQQQHQHA